MFDDFNLNVFLAITLAALATYVLRAGGLLLATRLPRSVRFRRGMNALPGTLMLSIVVPSIVEAGLWGIMAAAVTGLTAWRTGNMIAAMLVGMAVIFAQRQLGL